MRHRLDLFAGHTFTISGHELCPAENWARQDLRAEDVLRQQNREICRLQTEIDDLTSLIGMVVDAIDGERFHSPEIQRARELAARVNWLRDGRVCVDKTDVGS